MKTQTLLIVAGLSAILISGCKPVNVPDMVTIEPSQTAFLVPLEGQTSNQGSFDSEAFLQSAKVASKRIIIPKRWRSTGRGNDGEYIPTMRVIVVERHPVSALWAGQTAIVADRIFCSSGDNCTN